MSWHLRRQRIALAALLLFYSLRDDSDSSTEESDEESTSSDTDSEPQPQHRQPLPAAPEGAREVDQPSTENVVKESELRRSAAIVGEPVDQYCEDSDTDSEDDSGSAVEDGPMYIPPPKKVRGRKKSVATVDTTEAEGADADQEIKRKRFWSQRMYLQRERLQDHRDPKGVSHLDPTEELKILRMSEECFETLLNLVTPLIEKKATVMRQPVSSRQRLVALLRYLVTGQSMETLKFSTLLSPSLMGNSILPETCQAIIQVLSPKYMKFPEKKEDWHKIAREFSDSCDFPNCGGSLNARHVCIHSGKGTINHKNHNNYSSFVLATLVDANHKFISAEVIMDERDSDESAIRKWDFYQRLSQDSLDLPGNTETEGALDFVFAAPNSFPVHPRVLMTYPVKRTATVAKVTYNDRLTTVNQYADNALGLLATRFGIFRTTINVQAWKIDLIVRACCAIHNFLSVEGRREYISETTYDHRDEAGNLVLGEWRTNDDVNNYFSSLQTISREPFPETDNTREQYVEYFSAKLLEQDLSFVI